MARGATVRRFERPAILAGLAGALVAYLVAILWYSRFHLLDDSLIHLRLAELLLEHGFFTTDGYARSFGTSSPVFVAIAAALHHLAENDFTTKIISLFFYLVLVATLLGLAWRARAAARIGWTVLALLAISPFGVRWLTDGMETSLAACIALALGIAAVRTGPLSALHAAGLAVLGAVAVATRIEMTLLVALAALTITLRARSGTGPRPRDAVPLAAGAAAGLLLVWLCFGAILPDPALAKASGEAAPAASVLAIAISLGGALGFGLGLTGLWLAGLSVGWRSGAAPRAVLVAPNLALVALWGAISIRGQYVQGIRYVLPTLIFMISANAALLGGTDLREAMRGCVPPGWLSRARSMPRPGWIAAAAVVAVFAFDFAKFQEIVENRTAAFLNMRALDLDALEGTSGIGWDVGHVMYFTKGEICDVSGLVNGREAAISPETLRLENCLKRDVKFLFVTSENAAELIDRSGTRFADWPVCGRYLFQNVSETEPHYLAVAPSAAPQVCPAGRDTTPLNRAALHPS